MAVTSPSRCIVCQQTTTTGLTPWHFVCLACDYESTTLTPAINHAHTRDVIDENAREKSLRAIRTENFKSIVAAAARLAPAGAPALLDVGCAHGWFLEEARKKFTVLGIEPDQEVRERAAAKGLPVRPGFFPEALQAGESFDVIVFNDVIEHIPDIQGALAAVNARLNPKGLLILNLPSSSGLFYRLSKLLARLGWTMPFERLWQKEMPSPHVHYFSKENITALVGGQGFRLESSFELPAIRAKGLLERFRYVKNAGRLASFVQYLIILCAIPVLKVFPSDIIVCIYRKNLDSK